MNRTIFVGTDLFYSQEYVDEIVKIANDYYAIINEIELHCLNSIYSINDILNTEKITHFTKEGICTNRNRYQIERLRAYRTKSKEILKLIRTLENSHYGKEVK